MSINIDVQGNTTPLERDVQNAVRRINRTGGIKIRIDEKGVTQPLGNMRRSADEFTKSLEASNARVLAFGASVGIINAVSEAFKGLVTSTMKVEKNLTDINVVMGLTNKQLDKFGGGLFKVAKETGAGFDAASEAATEFARQGLSVNETLKRTKDALILTRLTGMKAADSVKSLTAAMNTFKGEIADSTALVSKFAAVDVKFAVSAEDFAQAIARSGQAARDAGVDINQLIGLVTAAQERTARGGAVIGNSFKTIFTRVQRSSTLNELENIGIAVRDLQGNTMPAIKILESLAKKYDHLNDAQRAYISQNVAGVFQVNILKAALADLGKANSVTAQATQIAANATDESSKKNEQLRQTMSALAGETGVAVQQLAKVIGDIALAPGINKVLDGIKGLAEGATNLLGDGESQGSTFAKGLLKGIGNIITGPGLVIFGALFTKLFVNAAKYATSSLSSLLNMNKAASARKSVEQSLMQVLTQNAALQEQMLRTDISRVDKEKMILSIIKQQTAEATRLSSVTRSMVPGLMRGGVGANLSYSKPRRAFGFVPNFANGGDEKQMARAGGYAPGHLKSMNIPGEGGVVYNSSETVKNFPGMSQPAIMPPASSKAGENYKKVFGATHGFDPYAANGFVPNFAFNMASWLSNPTNRISKAMKSYKGLSSSEQKDLANWSSTPEAKRLITDSGLGMISGANMIKAYMAKQRASKGYAMLVPPEGYSAPVSFFGKGKNQISWPVYGLQKKAGLDEPNLSKRMRRSFADSGAAYATKIGKLVENPDVPVSAARFWKAYKSDKAGGASGAYNAAVGAVFETAVNTALKLAATQQDPAKGDFDVRNADIGKLSKVFDFRGGVPKFTLADYKNNSSSPGNRKSFYNKILKEQAYEDRFGVRKQNKAFGYIPNFASNPLSDAIEREKGAGVPVSQIRVGSHRRLQNQGNPMGIGVTNTKDEPNGLKDVFGASGFVPNYAALPTISSKDISPIDNPLARERAKQFNDLIARTVDKYKKGLITKEELNRRTGRLSSMYKLNADATQKVTTGVTNSIGPITRLNHQRNRLVQTYNQSQFAAGIGGKGAGFMGGMGRFQSGEGKGLAAGLGRGMTGMGGMGMMMGLGMGAGFLQESNPNAAGMMNGASMGMSVGMMLGPLGMVAGGAIGGLMGLMNASKKAEEAMEELRKKNAELAKQSQERSAQMRDQALLNNINSALSVSKQAFSGTASAISGQQFSFGAGNFISGDELFKGNLPFGTAPLHSLKTLAGGGSNQIQGSGTNFFKNLNLGNQQASREKLFTGDAAFKQIYKRMLLDNIPGGNAPMSNIITGTESLEELEQIVGDQELIRGLSTKAHVDLDRMRTNAIAGALERGSVSKTVPFQYRDQNIQRQIDFQKGRMQPTATGTNKRNAGQKTEAPTQETIDDANKQIEKLREQLYKTSQATISGVELAAVMRATNIEQVSSSSREKLQLVDDEDLNKFKNAQKDQFMLQLASAKEQSRIFIKSLDYQNIELEIRRQLNENLRTTSENYKKQANAAQRLSSIMGSNQTAVGLGAERIASRRRDINQTKESGLLNADATFRSNIFKSIKGDSVAAQQFKNLFGVDVGLDKQIQNIETRLAGANTQSEKTELQKRLATLMNNRELSGSAYSKLTGEGKVFKNDKQAKYFSDEVKKIGIDRALATLTDEQLLAIANTESLINSNEALAKVLRNHITARKNARTEVEKTAEFEEDQLKHTERIQKLLDQGVDARRKASEQLALDTKQFDIQNQQAEKALEIAKLRRQVAQGPGFIGLGAQTSNQVSDIAASGAIRRNSMIQQENFAARQFGIDQGELQDKRRILMSERRRTDSKSDEFQNLTIEINRLGELIKLREDERKAQVAAHKENLSFLDEEIQKTQQILQDRLAMRQGADAFSNGLNNAMAKMTEESREFKYNLGEAIPNAFANSMSNAMTNSIRQGKDLGDTLQDAAINFLSTINQMFAQQMARNLTQSIFGTGINTSQIKYRGGLVRRNKGGLVPGLVTNGEYRMNPKAVSKYGVSMMDAVNAGHLPRRNEGGGMSFGQATAGFLGSMFASKLFGKKEKKQHVARQKDRFETDGAFKKHNMSAYYMQNSDRVSAYVEDLRAQKRAQEQAWIQKQEKRAQLGRQVVSFIGNFAAQKMHNKFSKPGGLFDRADKAMGLGKYVTHADGTSGYMSPLGNFQTDDFAVHGGGKSKNWYSSSFLQEQGMGNVKDYSPTAGAQQPRISRYGEQIGGFFSGMAKKVSRKDKNKNSGGPVSGESGIDRIPAMLSEGEYVIRADAARKIGRPALEQINSGRYNTGGIVASNSAGTSAQDSGGSMSNNISITVNVSDSGTSESKEKEGSNDKKDKMDKMSARIKDQVVTVIKEESRPGGLLDKGGNQ